MLVVVASGLTSVGLGSVSLRALVVAAPGLVSVGFCGSTFGDVGLDCFWFAILSLGGFQ